MLMVLIVVVLKAVVTRMVLVVEGGWRVCVCRKVWVVVKVKEVEV